MGTPEKIGFKCEPISVTKLLMVLYLEKHVSEKAPRAKVLAFSEYIRTITDEDCEGLIMEFARREGIEEITYEDWEHDMEAISRLIEEDNRFKELVLSNQRLGHGLTGMGVFDKTTRNFYDCHFSEHWPTVRQIIQADYPQYFEAMNEFVYNTEKNEYQGITKNFLENFIMENFELAGADRPLHNYLKN